MMFADRGLLLYSGVPDGLRAQHVSAAGGALVSPQQGPQHVQPARGRHQHAGGEPLYNMLDSELNIVKP